MSDAKSGALAGAIVVVTGASGGLGGAVVEALCAAGAKVVAPCRSEAARAKLAGADSVETAAADLMREEDVAALFAGLERVDALVHLMGGFTMGPTHELSLEDWRAHHDLVLTSTFLCCKHALARMREAGSGRIVTVGSKAVVTPMGQMAAYSAAKAGVVALTKVIAEETKGTGISAACVLPSVIDTPANRAAMGDGDAPSWVTPAALAGTIVRLAGPDGAAHRGAAIAMFADA